MSIRPHIIDRLRKFSPDLNPADRHRFHELVVQTYALTPEDSAHLFRSEAQKGSVDDGISSKHSWQAVCFVCGDIAEQGWEFYLDKGDVFVEPIDLEPSDEQSASQIKSIVRTGLRRQRNRQLMENSVQEFLRSMETKRTHNDHRVSILDLVDSGADLVKQISSINKLSPDERQSKLVQLIVPEVIVADREERDEYTGLRLMDIWRYFRHTWSLEYRSMPARKLPILVRNKARPNKPIIGIAMLASPTLRLTMRDRWVGWDLDTIEKRLINDELKPSHVVKGLIKALDDAISEVRWDDLVDKNDVDNPSERVVFRLELAAEKAELQRKETLRNQDKTLKELRGLPKMENGETDWLACSEKPLFVKKRATALSHLLKAKIEFQKSGANAKSAKKFLGMFQNSKGRGAINTAITEVRKRILASQVSDLSVCGSIAPYSELLGGKLVTALVTSREVRAMYSKRYGDQVSEIASQVAGRPIKRSSKLAVLTTTSLYGISSSQYNRLHLKPIDNNDLPHEIRWEDLGRSAGYGTAHLSASTTESLKQVAISKSGFRHVNNIFGEGSSPRLRQIGEGLRAIGIASENILTHAQPRKIYACELTPGIRDQLLGFSPSKRKTRAPSVNEITIAWINRWLTKRILREESLKALKKLGPDTVKSCLWADDNGQFRLPLTVSS